MSKLALLGGKPTRGVWGHPQESASAEVVEAVRAVAASRCWSMFSSPAVGQLEDALAAYLGGVPTVMVSSGTASLHLALVGSGVRPGDGVVIPSVGYVAVPNAVRLAGAVPIFADIDINTFNLTSATVEEALLSSPSSLPVRALIVIDLFGSPADRDELLDLCRTNQLVFIEDCAHALGAKWRERLVGSFGVGCFSFSEGKALQTGEGGALSTQDLNVINRVRTLRHEGEVWRSGSRGKSAVDHKLSRLTDFLAGREAVEPGFNYRPTAFSAALAVTQLSGLERQIAKRTEIARSYREDLEQIPGISVQKVLNRGASSWNRFVFCLDSEEFGLNRDETIAALVAEGIPAGLYRREPLAHYPAFANFVRDEWSIPNSNRFCRRNVQVPIDPAMTRSDVQDVAGSLQKIHEAAVRDPHLQTKLEAVVPRVRISTYSGEFVFPPIEVGLSS